VPGNGGERDVRGADQAAEFALPAGVALFAVRIERAVLDDRRGAQQRTGNRVDAAPRLPVRSGRN